MDWKKLKKMLNRENIDCLDIVKYKNEAQLQISHAERLVYPAKLFIIKNDVGKQIYNEIKKYYEYETKLEKIDQQVPYPLCVIIINYTWADDHICSHSFSFENIESIESLSIKIDKRNAKYNYDNFIRKIKNKIQNKTE